MCEHGDTVPVYLKIPADLSSTGVERWRDVLIDRCIAGLVMSIQMGDVGGGIDMRSSCCGHGKRRFWWWPWAKVHGYINLQDGRCLVIKGVSHV